MDQKDKLRHLVDLAIKVGFECTKMMYDDMSNPEMRGSKFKWEFLPRMCETYATSSLAMALPEGLDRTLELRLREIARATANSHANRLLIEGELHDAMQQ